MPDRQLVFEDFSDKVGGAFVINDEGVPATAGRRLVHDPEKWLPVFRIMH